MSYYLYILYSKTKDRFYIGQTSDPDERLNYHNAGYVMSTKSGRPWERIFLKEFLNRSDAMKEESRLKKAKNRTYLEWYMAKG